MNSPLINYDLLYSPDIKKDNFKPKTLIQSSTTTTSSLLNPFKDLIERNMISLKNSNTHFTKPIFSPENLQKTTYPPVLNPSIVDLNNNALEKIKTSLKLTTSPFLSEKTNSKNNHNYECFKVFARIRPMNSKELSSININKKSTFLKTIVKLDETSVKLFPIEYQINNGKEEKIFSFDQVFDENDNNENIFKKTVLSPVENLLNGYNSTILAYGMTGTGKTHTMFGDIYCQNEGKDPEPGLIILAVKDIFWKIEIQINENRNLEFKIKLSYLEIYNEQVKDLLLDNSENLMILEDQGKGVVIPDLTEIQLNNPSEILKFIDQGNGRRTMASTSSNQFSSRSHAILIISIEKRNLTDSQQIIYARFCLVDLAGSERALLSDVKGIRMTEGANINRSLLALGNCINILSDNNKKGAFVPYRDSKLTRLLKESLGGNTKTIMIACLSPSSFSYEETLNTLKYASRAKNIKRKISKNIREIEDVTEYKGIIEILKNEIISLKEQLVEKNQKQFPLNVQSSEEHITRKKEELKIYEKNFQLQGKIENISKKILTNLEENWEIKQSVLELKNLKHSNDIAMKEKKHNLEILKHENPIFLNTDPLNKFLYNNISNGSDTRKTMEISTLQKDLKALEETMQNNDKILTQMEEHMLKTVETRDRLHVDMVKLHEKNSEKLVNDLKTACEILNKEKMNLHAQNLEMKKKEENMAKIQEEKDSRIKEMQREIEKMKKKLDEKDKIIEENKVIIENLSSNNPEIIKSTLTKYKNYRSNTSENAKIQKISFQKTGSKFEGLTKNTSGIRQYFKGKSAGSLKKNSKYIQKSKEFQNLNNDGEGLNSNRSNFDVNGIKNNLDKLSECSSLTRFEAGNIEASKSSLILPAEEVSPYLQTKVYRSSVEGLEDIECTKKIVDNLSEVSSILQEDSQNFSVSDQIMFENIERNSLKTKKKSSNLHSNEKLILKVDINPAFHKKNMKKTEEKRNFLNIYKSIDNPSLMDKRKADELKTPKNNIDSNIPKTSDNANNFLIEKNNTNNNDFKIQYNNNNDFNSKKQIEYHHVRTTNGSSQEIFYSNDYKLYLFKDRVQKAYSELEMAKSDKNKDNPLIFKEIFELVLENNKSSFNLDDHTSKMFTDLRNFYHKSLPKGSELNRSFLEKNRSSSANSVNDKKEVFTKPNIKAVTNKATNPPSNSSFIRTYTEKGFYDSVDKNKKGQLHYVKYRSINLQDGLAFNQQEKNTTQTNPTKKTDSIHSTKNDEKKIPWDELINKKEKPDVRNIISKQREHLKEEYEKLEEQKSYTISQIHTPLQRIGNYNDNFEGKKIAEKPQESEKRFSNSKGFSSPMNFKNNFKNDFNSYAENYNKSSVKK